VLVRGEERIEVLKHGRAARIARGGCVRSGQEARAQRVVVEVLRVLQRPALVRAVAEQRMRRALVAAALFAVSATIKALMLGLPSAVAVTMGLLTGIGGGLLRDVLAGRPTLLMLREIYATPILLGCTLFAVLRHLDLDLRPAASIAVAVIVGLRALAIRRHLEMPGWLTQKAD
jgi:uncharacterized membrane protein YeiH